MLNPTAFPEIDAALTEYLRALEREFGDELLSVYLLGSLSTGSFIPGLSDVNGVIITRQNNAHQLGAQVRATCQALLASHPDWQRWLFTGCISADALKNTTWENHPLGWGLVDLTNLVEDGRLIWGQELAEATQRPTLEELRAFLVWELAGVIESSASGPPLPLRAPTGAAWDHYRQHPLQVLDWLIYPARMLLTWNKGRVGSKSEAVNHYIEEYHGPWEPALLQADTLRRTGNLALLTPETLALFAGQAPSLFEWAAKHLLTILRLPSQMATAAHSLRRWLERDLTLAPPQPGAPYDTFVSGGVGERTSPTQSNDPHQPPDTFIPSRKPWLRK